MSMAEPIALALVRRSDGHLLTLQGLMKVDLPGTHVAPGQGQESSLTRRLELLGVFAPRLRFRWSAVVAWRGSMRPVSVFEADGWSGTPTEECSWSTEEELSRGQRAEVYRRCFAKIRWSASTRSDEGAAGTSEAPIEKPRPHPCPRCGAGLVLRKRRIGEEASFACITCASSYVIRSGVLQRAASSAG